MATAIEGFRPARANDAAARSCSPLRHFFLIVAAVQHDASQSKGISGSLQELAQHGWGRILLWITAIGLLSCSESSASPNPLPPPLLTPSECFASECFVKGATPTKHWDGWSRTPAVPSSGPDVLHDPSVRRNRHVPNRHVVP